MIFASLLLYCKPIGVVITFPCLLSLVTAILIGVMVKSAVQRKSTAPVAQDELDRSLAVFAAKQQFISVAMNMGWQLALTILIPVFVGVKLDDYFHSTPSYTLAALVIAIGGAVVVVWKTLDQVKKEQAANPSYVSKVKENKK